LELYGAISLKFNRLIIYQGLRRTQSYIENELDSLEKEQEQIDQQARELEKILRDVMKSGK